MMRRLAGFLGIVAAVLAVAWALDRFEASDARAHLLRAHPLRALL